MGKATALKHYEDAHIIMCILSRINTKIACNGAMQTVFYPAESLSSVVSCSMAFHQQITIRKNELSSQIKRKMM